MLEYIDISGLTGIVITPDSAAYHEARQEYNRAIQKFPLVIVCCLCVRDVRNAVLWARANEIGIRIRSGGHNYEGYSVGNAVLVIDLSRLNHIRIDKHRRTVRIEGGASNRAVYTALAQAGLAFAGGSCPTVGVSGYALGVGWNFLCRPTRAGSPSLRSAGLTQRPGSRRAFSTHGSACCRAWITA